MEVYQTPFCGGAYTESDNDPAQKYRSGQARLMAMYDELVFKCQVIQFIHRLVSRVTECISYTIDLQ